MKKQNIAIIAVVAFVLAVAVGYALFSETITINGSATAKGDFDVEIISAVVTAEEGATGSASVADDKNSVDLDANLQYPGAYVEYKVTVNNKGSIEAVLDEVRETSQSDIKAPVVVTYDSLDKDSLTTGETDVYGIKVQWNPADEADEETDGTIDNAVDVETGYTVEFDYKQVTVPAGN